MTAEELALTSVPGEPNAPAVVLFKKGEFRLAGYGLQNGLYSSLHVQARMKILTEEGKSNGEITIVHSDSVRLHRFQARTVLPDGRVIPVPADAKFVRKTSHSRKRFVTAVAFPSVQVGAILDYRYSLSFDSVFFLKPWYFSESVPVRYAEIVFKTPMDLAARTWGRGPSQVKVHSESKAHIAGNETRIWAENLPAVPDDPYGPPFEDLALQMLLLPVSRGAGTQRQPLLESWPGVCALVGGEAYEPAPGREGGVARQAREIAGAGSPRQQAEALYRFVRDEIETVPARGDRQAGANLAKVLRDGTGDRAEKALLMRAMLKAAGIDSRLVWAADRNRGLIDIELPNPAWFDALFLAVDLDGEWAFLDPSDRALGFGRLRAGYEGTPALLFDPRKPEAVSLPETPFEQNLRRAEIELALDERGRLAGTGVLRLTGHPALERIGWQEDEAKTLEAWKNWLAAGYRDFQISDVTALEEPDEALVIVTWAMAQRDEEVLGDEASLVPSAPLGPVTQPFVQTVASRRSSVLFDYPDRAEVELRLRWPAGWKVEGRPREISVHNLSGDLALAVEMDEADRSLVLKRRFDVTRRELSTTKEYDAVRSLFGEAEKSDAQKLLLVRR